MEIRIREFYKDIMKKRICARNYEAYKNLEIINQFTKK